MNAPFFDEQRAFIAVFFLIFSNVRNDRGYDRGL